MTSDQWLTAAVAALGLLGVIFTQRQAAGTAARRLDAERGHWEDERRAADYDAWRETKRECFIAFLRAHTLYWQKRDDIQQQLDVLRLLVLSDEDRREREAGARELTENLYIDYRAGRALAAEVSLYDLHIGAMCKESFAGAPDATGQGSDRAVEQERSRGEIDKIVRHMQQSLGLDNMQINPYRD